MKTPLAIMAVFGLLASHAFGQGAQADQIKRRARELSNQNNVRQGIPSPARPAVRPSAPVTRPAMTAPATTQQQNIAKLQADLTPVKAGSPATPELKQQVIKDIAVACRGTKPSLQSVTAFVKELTAALAEKTLDSPGQKRLAQDIEAVLNSAGMSSSQFDAIIDDVQAILQVEGTKRTLAITAAKNLRTVGTEVRRGAR